MGLTQVYTRAQCEHCSALKEGWVDIHEPVLGEWAFKGDWYKELGFRFVKVHKGRVLLLCPTCREMFAAIGQLRKLHK